MKVADILRVKGGTLFTVSPDQSLHDALETMAERDIGSLEVGKLADISNSGTLFAFLVVSLAVMLLRRSEPDRPRSFRTPMVWLIGPLSVIGDAVIPHPGTQGGHAQFRGHDATITGHAEETAILRQ